MKKPRLLDLFCGAGGAGMGYHRAGFEVVGVDIRPQPHYPFEFHRLDAMDVLALMMDGLVPWGVSRTRTPTPFDAIHASPPCERYSQLTPKAHRNNHEDLIGDARRALVAIGAPYVIENVPSAKWLLRHPMMLCGTMFGLGIRRHRFFETSFSLSSLIQGCNHEHAPVLISGTHRRTYEPRYEYSAAACREASGIDWMTRAELDKAIPPAYTEYIGRQLLAALERAA